MIQKDRYCSLSIGPEADGLRLDVFLAQSFSRSRASVHRRLAGQVLDAFGVALKWSHRVKHRQTIRVKKLCTPEPCVKVSYKILFEDEWILAVDKGPGAPVHPSRSWKNHTILSHLIKDTGQQNLKPVHRLDRDTSGVLVFAKTAAAVRALMDQFRTGKVQKRYLAIIEGSRIESRFTVDAPIGKDSDFPISCRMRIDRISGLKSITKFEVISCGNRKTLLSARPVTGRQHQIRVHLAHLQRPIIGDKLYRDNGKPYLAMLQDRLTGQDIERLGHTRQALHAASIHFTHPDTGREMLFEAPFPEDLKNLM